MEITFAFLEIQKVIIFNQSIKKQIQALIQNEGKKLGTINFIFTSNAKILSINREFLNHHYYTDVITFNYNRRSIIAGDIFISIDQVILNAKQYNSSFTDELVRIMIHGVLHLIGYNDKQENEKIVMREKEDGYLCTFRKFDLVKKSEIQL